MDKELSKRIQSVFEAYDEPYDPGNWRRLVRKKRKRIWLGYVYRGSIAASLAAVLLAAGWLLFRDAEPPRLAGTADGEESPSVQEEQREARDPGAAEENAPVLPGGTPEQPLAREERVLPSAVTEREQVHPEPPAESKDIALPVAPEPVVYEGLTPAAVAAVSPQVQLPAVQKRPEVMLRLPAAGQDVPASRKPGDRPDEPSRLSGRQDRQQGNRTGDIVVVGEESKEKEKSGTSRLSFGFMTTSLLNYAKGNQANQVQFGAGLTSGLRLGQHFSIHSGIILAQNSLSLNQSSPVVQSGRTAQSQQDAYFNSTSNPEAKQANIFVEDVNQENLDIDLLLVDIPLNVTYQVNVKKMPLLITGGISSFAYIDQKFTSYNSIELYNKANKVPAPQPKVNEEGTLSHFDLFRQLNFAVGTRVPLGTRTSLVIEPYVKVPLGELTSERVRYGSAGMSLRLNFDSSKKQ